MSCLKVTVCIPTLNREKVISNLLSSLEKSSEYIAEVMICDQGDSDLLVKELDLLDIKGLKIFYYKVKFKSLTRARNFLAYKSSSEYLCYLDDDSQVFDNYFEFLQNEIKTGVLALTGPVLNPGVELKSKELFTKFEQDNSEKIHHTLSNADFDHYAAWFPGGNFTVRKDLLIKSGGFEELFFGSAIGEDAEISKRLRRLFGIKIKYNKNCGIFHFPPGEGGCHAEKKIAYTRSVAANVNFLFLIVPGDTWYKLKKRIQMARSLVLNNSYTLIMKIKMLNAFFSGTIKGFGMALKKWCFAKNYLLNCDSRFADDIVEFRIFKNVHKLDK